MYDDNIYINTFIYRTSVDAFTGYVHPIFSSSFSGGKALIHVQMESAVGGNSSPLILTESEHLITLINLNNILPRLHIIYKIDRCYRIIKKNNNNKNKFYL